MQPIIKRDIEDTRERIKLKKKNNNLEIKELKNELKNALYEQQYKEEKFLDT